MNQYDKLLTEFRRIADVLAHTGSDKLRNDYVKYLARLNKDLNRQRAANKKFEA